MAKFYPILSEDYFKKSESGYPIANGIYLSNKDIIKVDNDHVSSILYKAVDNTNGIFDIFKSFDNIAFNIFCFNNLLFDSDTNELGYWGNCLNPLITLYNDNYGYHLRRLNQKDYDIFDVDEVANESRKIDDWFTWESENEELLKLVESEVNKPEPLLSYNKAGESLELVSYGDIADYISLLSKGERRDSYPITLDKDRSVTDVKYLQTYNQTHTAANSAYYLEKSLGFSVSEGDIVKLIILYANDYSDDYVISTQNHEQVAATYVVDGVTGKIIWISNSFNAIVCRFHGGNADGKPDEYVFLSGSYVTYTQSGVNSPIIWLPPIIAESGIDNTDDSLFDAITFDRTIVSYGNFNIKVAELVIPALIDTDFSVGELVVECDKNGIRLHSKSTKVKEFFIASCLILKNNE